jgi:hypothetical protein
LTQWYSHEEIVARAQDAVRKRKKEQQEAAEPTRLSGLTDRALTTEHAKLDGDRSELRDRVAALPARVKTAQERRSPELAALQDQLTQLEYRFHGTGILSRYCREEIAQRQRGVFRCELLSALPGKQAKIEALVVELESLDQIFKHYTHRDGEGARRIAIEKCD